jgi:hypothetical protein
MYKGKGWNKLLRKHIYIYIYIYITNFCHLWQLFNIQFYCETFCVEHYIPFVVAV